MKKVLIAFLMSVFSSHSMGQTAKGMNTMALNLSFYTNATTYSNSDSKNTNASIFIYPRYGYLVNDHLELGLGVSYSYFKYKSNMPTSGYFSENSENIFSISPYLKYYWKLSEHFYFDIMVVPSFGFGSGKTTTTGNLFEYHNERSIAQGGIAVSPGFAFVFNNHWAVNLGLGSMNFSSTVKKDNVTKEKTTDNNFTFNGSFAGGLSLGASYYF